MKHSKRVKPAQDQIGFEEYRHTSYVAPVCLRPSGLRRDSLRLSAPSVSSRLPARRAEARKTRRLVGARGFEPPTPSPPDWCANRAALRSAAPTCTTSLPMVQGEGSEHRTTSRHAPQARARVLDAFATRQSLPTRPRLGET